jgi:hypothetical protein
MSSSDVDNCAQCVRHDNCNNNGRQRLSTSSSSSLPVNKIRCLPIPPDHLWRYLRTPRRFSGAVLREKTVKAELLVRSSYVVFALSVRFSLDAIIAALSAHGSDFGFRNQVKTQNVKTNNKSVDISIIIQHYNTQLFTIFNLF